MASHKLHNVMATTRLYISSLLDKCKMIVEENVKTCDLTQTIEHLQSCHLEIIRHSED